MKWVLLLWGLYIIFPQAFSINGSSNISFGESYQYLNSASILALLYDIITIKSKDHIILITDEDDIIDSRFNGYAFTTLQ